MSAQQPQSNNNTLVLVLIGLILMIGLCGLAYLVGLIAPGNLVSSEPTAIPATSTPLPAPVVTIQGIQTQAELSTLEYTTVTEIYNENLPEGYLDEVLGTRERILMLVYGNVRAGIDLETIDEDDIWTDGERVRLVLPAPEILGSEIDFERTRIVFYENSLLFESNNPDLQAEALSRAKDALEEAALEADIISQAGVQAQLYFENFLYSLGFTDVEVVLDAQIFQE